MACLKKLASRCISNGIYQYDQLQFDYKAEIEVESWWEKIFLWRTKLIGILKTQTASSTSLSNINIKKTRTKKF